MHSHSDERFTSIAIEEHYWDPELAAHFSGVEAGRGDKTQQRILDINGLRLAELDEAGIDMQILSHGPPGVLKLARSIALSLSKASTTASLPTSLPPRNGLPHSQRCQQATLKPLQTNSSVRSTLDSRAL